MSGLLSTLPGKEHPQKVVTDHPQTETPLVTPHTPTHPSTCSPVPPSLLTKSPSLANNPTGSPPKLSFDAPLPLGWAHGSLLPPTRPVSLLPPQPTPLNPHPAFPPLGQRSDPRAHGPQAPRLPPARTADGAAQRATVHRAARVPIRGPGAPAARPPNPARAPQTKGPAAPASHRRPRNLLAGKCPSRE